MSAKVIGNCMGFEFVFELFLIVVRRMETTVLKSVACLSSSIEHLVSNNWIKQIKRQ